MSFNLATKNPAYERNNIVVHLDYFLLADAAIATDGKHYIHGAGWDTITSASFPTVHPLLSLAARFWVNQQDAGRSYRVECDLYEVATQETIGSRVGGEMAIARETLNPLGRCTASIVMNLQMTSFPREGTYKVRFFVDNEEIASTDIHLVKFGPVPGQVSKPNA